MGARQTAKIQKTPLTIFGVEFAYLGILAIAAAFLGWVAENVVRLIVHGVWDCRFHVLPFISPYMLVVFALHIAFGNPDDIVVFGKRIFKTPTKKTKVVSNITVLVTMLIFVFLGELAIGNLWEILFGVKLWNYGNLPFSVTQYAGLVPTLGYGCGAYLLFKFMYAPALRLLRNKVSLRAAALITYALGTLLILDTAAMLIQLAVLHRPPMYWSISFR